MKTIASGVLLALLFAAPATAQSLDANVPTPSAPLQATSSHQAAAHKAAKADTIAAARADKTADTVWRGEFDDPDPVIRFHLFREAGFGQP
jgi:hypothetical protein